MELCSGAHMDWEEILLSEEQAEDAVSVVADVLSPFPAADRLRLFARALVRLKEYDKRIATLDVSDPPGVADAVTRSGTPVTGGATTSALSQIPPIAPAPTRAPEPSIFDGIFDPVTGTIGAVVSPTNSAAIADAVFSDAHGPALRAVSKIPALTAFFASATPTPTIKDRIHAFLTAHTGSTPKDVAAAVYGAEVPDAPNRARALLHQMRKEGKVVVVQGHWQAVPPEAQAAVRAEVAREEAQEAPPPRPRGRSDM